MPGVKYVPVLTLIEFTGNNVNELPLENYLNAYDTGAGKTSVANGVLTIRWPGIDGSIPVEINTGDLMDANGTIYTADQIAGGYVKLSDLSGLL